MGEQRIRDLNDDINDLMKEKGRWEARIKHLGGPDYRKINKEATDEYQYYGAAKDLPRVRELLGKDKPSAPIKNYQDLSKKVGYDYFKNDISEELLSEEKSLEEKLRKQAVDEFNAKRKDFEKSRKRIKTGENEKDEKLKNDGFDSDDSDFENIYANNFMDISTKTEMDTNVTADGIRKLILKKKKEALIKKYASEALDEKKEDTNMKIIEE